MTLHNQAFAFNKLGEIWGEIQKLQQAKQLYADLGLNHKVEQCDSAIYNFNRLRRFVKLKPPPISTFSIPTIGDLPPSPEWWEKSLPTPTQPKPQSDRKQVPVWLRFLIGLAIVLLIASLL